MRSLLRATRRSGGCGREPAAAGFFWVGAVLVTALLGAVVYAVPAGVVSLTGPHEQMPARYGVGLQDHYAAPCNNRAAIPG